MKKTIERELRKLINCNRVVRMYKKTGNQHILITQVRLETIDNIMIYLNSPEDYIFTDSTFYNIGSKELYKAIRGLKK